MRRFTVLLRKELRELLTLQMLIPFALVIVVFMFVGNVAGQENEEAAARQGIGVVDQDSTASSAILKDALEQSGFDVEEMDKLDSDTIRGGLANRDLTIGVIIPAGFEDGLSTGEPVSVDIFAVVKRFSFMALRDADTVKGVLSAVNEGLSTQLITEAIPGRDPSVVKRPVGFTEHVILGENQAVAQVGEVYGFVTSQTTFIPIVLFMVIVFASQMIATTIATEKENKTLETMLASPVSRTALIMAKMVAAGIIALLSAAVYMVGLRSYLTGVTGGEAGSPFQAPDAAVNAAEALGLGLSVVDWTLLGLTLFMAILIALAIAVILGAFAENVKAVQSLMAPLMMLVLIPYFLTLLTDIESTSTVVRTLVMAIPFTHAFTAAPNLFLGEYTRVLAGVGYMLVWVVVLVTIGTRVFNSDRILTMKLSLSRKKQPQQS